VRLQKHREISRLFASREVMKWPAEGHRAPLACAARSGVFRASFARATNALAFFYLHFGKNLCRTSNCGRVIQRRLASAIAMERKTQMAVKKAAAKKPAAKKKTAAKKPAAKKTAAKKPAAKKTTAKKTTAKKPGRKPAAKKTAAKKPAAKKTVAKKKPGRKPAAKKAAAAA
jgi:hypothetical protein